MIAPGSYRAPPLLDHDRPGEVRENEHLEQTARELAGGTDAVT